MKEKENTKEVIMKVAEYTYQILSTAVKVIGPAIVKALEEEAQPEVRYILRH